MILRKQKLLRAASSVRARLERRRRKKIQNVNFVVHVHAAVSFMRVLGPGTREQAGATSSRAPATGSNYSMFCAQTEQPTAKLGAARIALQRLSNIHDFHNGEAAFNVSVFS